MLVVSRSGWALILMSHTHHGPIKIILLSDALNSLQADHKVSIPTPPLANPPKMVACVAGDEEGHGLIGRACLLLVVGRITLVALSALEHLAVHGLGLVELLLIAIH